MTDDGFLAEPPTLFLTDADVAALADWDDAIAALREAYTRPDDPTATPERAVAVTATGWQRVMASAPSGARFAGSKTIAASLRNGLASYLITLFDQHDSRLAALVDGNRITGLRTAATAAAALGALVPERTLTAAVVGSGFEARAQRRRHPASRDSATCASPVRRRRIAKASQPSCRQSWASPSRRSRNHTMPSAVPISCCAPPARATNRRPCWPTGLPPTRRSSRSARPPAPSASWIPPSSVGPRSSSPTRSPRCSMTAGT